MIHIIIALFTALFVAMIIYSFLHPKDIKEFEPQFYHITDEAGREEIFPVDMSDAIQSSRDIARMKIAVKDWSSVCRVKIYQGGIEIDSMFLEDLF